MAEAIISRRGYGVEGKPKKLTSSAIVVNTAWKVPNGVSSIDVRIFGGGGGGGLQSGGGGGWMNNGTIGVYEGQIINITIGKGGNSTNNSFKNGGSGGTTSFGTYLSANGGEGGKGQARRFEGGNGGSGGGSMYGNGGEGYQFGGGGAYSTLSTTTTIQINRKGGNGGIWGGGGGIFCGGGGNIISQYIQIYAYGGTGGMYGGGGGSHTKAFFNNYPSSVHIPSYCYAYGGNGGLYGGGGGAVSGAHTQAIANYGYGGTYGGNGGSGIINSIRESAWSNYTNIYDSSKPANNGVNTIGMNDILTAGNDILTGNGECGNIVGSGGGGYGGSTNINYIFGDDNRYILSGGIGGGGYGGSYNQLLFNMTKMYIWGGGGCGYGSSGGLSLGGGGGGYGRIADGGSYCGGGGGYFSKGGNGFSIIQSIGVMAGGGGGYGDGGGADTDTGYGGGGMSYHSTELESKSIGGNGICIIQWYE